MHLEHLRYAAEIEKCGSITKAAKALYMGQPNLSKAIHELEGEIGIEIFHRTPRGVAPTDLGRQFLTYAKTVISQMDELESLYKPQSEPVFQFSVSVPRATYITVGFTDFLAAAPTDAPMSVSFKETSGMGAITDVVGGNSQIAVVRVPDQYDDYYSGLFRTMKLRADLLWEFRMSLLMSRSHPLADWNEIPYHMLDGYLEICHGDV
ncbi:MAG: LysR family transcriptional regulator, partial [Pseudoflavonifractor sp.]